MLKPLVKPKTASTEMVEPQNLAPPFQSIHEKHGEVIAKRFL